MYQADDFRSSYARKSTEALLDLALRGARDLKPEALDLLRIELNARDIHPAIDRAIRFQLQPPSEGEKEALVARFRSLACPVCGRSESPLTASWVTRASYFLLFTRFHSELIVGCAPCIDAAATRANKSLLKFGWWSPPLGLVWSIQGFLRNRRTRNPLYHVAPTPELRAYVSQNLGEVVFRVESGAA
jgi:hypothetical protein